MRTCTQIILSERTSSVSFHPISKSSLNAYILVLLRCKICAFCYSVDSIIKIPRHCSCPCIHPLIRLPQHRTKLDKMPKIIASSASSCYPGWRTQTHLLRLGGKQIQMRTWKVSKWIGNHVWYIPLSNFPRSRSRCNAPQQHLSRQPESVKLTFGPV